MPNSRLPNPGLFIDDTLIELFRTSIDQIIADAGRNVKLILSPRITPCPNCGRSPRGDSNGVYDTSNPNPIGPLNRPFPAGGTCPVCLGSHQIKTENSATWKASIQKNPKDFDFEAEGALPENVVRTNMEIGALNDVKNCLRAVIDSETYTRLRAPITTGLRDLVYVKTFWVKITN
jgi:hypothetical protein